MRKDPKSYLLDIEQAIEDIVSYSNGMTKKNFFTNILLQDGIIRKISVIGEAVKRLPVSVTRLEKAIPWNNIAGMRDIVVHDYSDIDLDIVWKVVKVRLPELNKAVKRLLTRCR